MRLRPVQQFRSVFRSRGDSLISACALVAILAWIVVSDMRLHDQMTRRIQGATFDLAGAGARLQGMTTAMVTTAEIHSLEFAHFWTFLAVAVVLTIWMFRT